MNVNDVLNKVTLKLPEGGEFPLSKYVPYITNSTEEVKELVEESWFKFHSPTGFAIYDYNTHNWNIVKVFDEEYPLTIKNLKETVLEYIENNNISLVYSDILHEGDIFLESVWFSNDNTANSSQFNFLAYNGYYTTDTLSYNGKDFYRHYIPMQ